MSDEILAFARARNVSKIVVGKPERPLWKRIAMGSIVDALVRGSGEIDVYVISGDRETSRPAAAPYAGAQPPDWARVRLRAGRGRGLHRDRVGSCSRTSRSPT